MARFPSVPLGTDPSPSDLPNGCACRKLKWSPVGEKLADDSETNKLLRPKPGGVPKTLEIRWK